MARCASYAHLATAPQHIPTQHDMLPQYLFCKYELNCEYCNIPLARNKAPWWWSDKIETCRSVLKCFIWNYMCIRWLINWSDSTKNARCYNKIYKTLHVSNSSSVRHQEFFTLHTAMVCWQLARRLSTNLYDIYHCCMYSEKFLMMDRGTVRNM